MKRSTSVKKRVMTAVSVIVTLCAVLFVVALFLTRSSFFKDPTVKNSDGTIEDVYNTPSVIKDKMANFLVVGVSNDPNLREDDNMTDTIMVVSCDFEAQKISILQIPRDSYVGYETNSGKINAIYGQNPEKWDYAGLDGLVQMIHEMFGLTIDHYATVQMDGFADVVDAIGGVTMDVPKEMVLDGVRVSPGKQTLNGQQAIAVVRVRNIYANADLGRLDTQKLFMSAFAEQCLQLSVADMAKLLPTLSKSVTTDLSVADMIEYYKLVQNMQLGNISVMTVPGEGLYTEQTNIGRQAVYSVYREETADLLNEYFRPYSPKMQADELQITELTQDHIAGSGDQVSTFDDLAGSQSTSSASE